jgi:REP element-mobilizing transposase RayT
VEADVRSGTKSRGAEARPGARRKHKRPRTVQGDLFARTWGGARRGAGRKRRGLRRSVAHRARKTFRAACPVHVTLRLVDGLPSLRKPATYRELVRAMGGGHERFGLGLAHWSVLGNHMHLILETGDSRALSRGMQGLNVRLAKALNRWWQRTGRVFADRYHARTLRSPSAVRKALSYVLQNARRHGFTTADTDAFSSAPWFDGWLGGCLGERGAVERPAWLRAPRTWLLARGWRLLGLLEIESPPAEP